MQLVGEKVLLWFGTNVVEKWILDLESKELNTRSAPHRWLYDFGKSQNLSEPPFLHTWNRAYIPVGRSFVFPADASLVTLTLFLSYVILTELSIAGHNPDNRTSDTL